MSPAARLFHDRLYRRASMLAPDLRDQLFRGFARLRSLISDTDLEAFIHSPSADRLLGEALTVEQIEASFAPLSKTIRDGIESAGRALASELPGMSRGVSFNVVSPKAVDAIRVLNTRVISQLSDNVRESVRGAVERGLAAGKPSKAIARELREIVELSPRRTLAVENFRRLLEAGDLEALSRELRDKRFDSVIRSAFAGEGLTPAKLDQIVEAYRKNQIVSQAENLARTAALDAQRLAQRLNWIGAIDRGEVDGNHLFRRYSGVLDEVERDEHLLLEGEVVRWDELYSSGQAYAGEDDFNCRCLDIFFIASNPATARRPGAGARGLTPDQLRVSGLLQQLGRTG